MMKILAVAWKEFIQITRDPLTMIMLLGLPAFMLVVFGYAVNFDVWDLPLAVEDRDKSPASRELVSSFLNSGRFKLTVNSAGGMDVHTLFENGDARAALIIPERFGRTLAGGGSAPVQMIIDGTDSNTASTALSYSQGVIQTFNSVQLQRALRTAGAERALDAAIDVQPRVFYNPELRSAHFLVPGLVGFILMITAVLSTALSVVREKERGTMEQLGVAPLGTVQVLLGKTVPYMIISLAATVFILLAARFLFGVEVRGSYVDLFLATGLYLLGGFGMGLLISTLAGSQAIAFQVSIFVSMLPTLLLSGFIFPIRNMPAALQVISHIVPARYYLVVLRGIILKGTSLAPYWDQIGALAIFTIVVLGLAAVRFARRGV